MPILGTPFDPWPHQPQTQPPRPWTFLTWPDHVMGCTLSHGHVMGWALALFRWVNVPLLCRMDAAAWWSHVHIVVLSPYPTPTSMSIGQSNDDRALITWPPFLGRARLWSHVRVVIVVEDPPPPPADPPPTTTTPHHPPPPPTTTTTTTPCLAWERDGW